QTNVCVGLLCNRDIKRRRKTSALPTRMSADILFHREELGEEAIPPPEAVATSEGMEELPAALDPPDLYRPQTSFDPQRSQLDN
ncbi:hypothetical protein NHX12_019733, partial [Muraenolepis orangiensis]